MTGIKPEELALEVLNNNGIQYEVCSQEEDWEGTDIRVLVGKNRYINVDLKGEATLQEYPKTVLMSIALRNKGSSEWKKPKYLERDDIWLCICDVTNMKDMFILSPKDIQNIMNKVDDGRILKKFKDEKHDFFRRDHILAVIKKTDCSRNFDL